MKRNLLKVAFAALCLLGIQSFTGMSQILAENIILRPITPTPPPSNDDGTPRHRAPQQSVVPAVEINDACDELTFTGSASISAQIEIEDELGDVVLVQALVLSNNEQVSLSVAELPEGDYVLRLTIGDKDYEGEFSK